MSPLDWALIESWKNAGVPLTAVLRGIDAAFEEKLIATLKSAQSEEQLFTARRELDAQLRPYRGKMSAEQLAMLERQYLERRLLEQSRLPRLSLFYMR